MNTRCLSITLQLQLSENYFFGKVAFCHSNNSLKRKDKECKTTQHLCIIIAKVPEIVRIGVEKDA
jgi:hypothetical protein